MLDSPSADVALSFQFSIVPFILPVKMKIIKKSQEKENIELEPLKIYDTNTYATISNRLSLLILIKSRNEKKIEKIKISYRK